MPVTRSHPSSGRAGARARRPSGRPGVTSRGPPAPGSVTPGERPPGPAGATEVHDRLREGGCVDDGDQLVHRVAEAGHRRRDDRPARSLVLVELDWVEAVGERRRRRAARRARRRAAGRPGTSAPAGRRAARRPAPRALSRSPARARSGPRARASPARQRPATRRTARRRAGHRGACRRTARRALRAGPRARRRGRYAAVSTPLGISVTCGRRPCSARGPASRPPPPRSARAACPPARGSGDLGCGPVGQRPVVGDVVERGPCRRPTSIAPTGVVDPQHRVAMPSPRPRARPGAPSARRLTGRPDAGAIWSARERQPPLAYAVPVVGAKAPPAAGSAAAQPACSGSVAGSTKSTRRSGRVGAGRRRGAGCAATPRPRPRARPRRGPSEHAPVDASVSSACRSTVKRRRCSAAGRRVDVQRSASAARSRRSAPPRTRHPVRRRRAPARPRASRDGRPPRRRRRAAPHDIASRTVSPKCSAGAVASRMPAAAHELQDIGPVAEEAHRRV